MVWAVAGHAAHVHVEDPRSDGDGARFVVVGEGEIDYPAQPRERHGLGDALMVVGSALRLLVVRARVRRATRSSPKRNGFERPTA